MIEKERIIKFIEDYLGVIAEVHYDSLITQARHDGEVAGLSYLLDYIKAYK